MSDTQVRQQLHKFIDLADERMIRAMYAMLKNYLQEDEGIVAFTVDGKPLTKQDVLASITDAISEVENGKGLSTEDIRKAKENW